MILTSGSTKVTIPMDNPRQRIIKINGITHDFVVIEIDGLIYLNSISQQYLEIVLQYIKVPLHESSTPKNKLYNSTIIELTGKSRQYQGLTGYLMQVDYKNIQSAAGSIAHTLISYDSRDTTHRRLVDILNGVNTR